MVWHYDSTMPTPELLQLSDMSPRLRESLCVLEGIDPCQRLPQFTTRIELFIQNRSRCFLEFHVARFISTLSLPSSDPQAPHEALVDAMLLVGCYFSRSPSLAGYELSCLTHALTKLSQALKDTDRLHDYIRASNLIAFYYLSKGVAPFPNAQSNEISSVALGLYQEASQQLIASTHMAVTCGLHQIMSAVWRPPSPQQTQNKFLPPAANNIELGERIYTFWQVSSDSLVDTGPRRSILQTFCFDKMVAMAAEKKPYLTNGPQFDQYLAVTTPWPRSFVDYETVSIIVYFHLAMPT